MNEKGREAKPLHLGHRQRIKDRFVERGLISLDDKDIIELILTYAIPRRDVYTLARELVHEFGTADGVLNADPAALKKQFGLTDHILVLFKLINDLRTKPYRAAEYRRARLGSVLSALQYCHRVLGGNPEETVVELMLDEDNVVTELTKVSCGSNDTVVLPIETIVKNAEFIGAKRVLIAHNHPSGSSVPSGSDLTATRALKSALGARGIDLLEHIIVSRDECTAIIHKQTILIKQIGKCFFRKTFYTRL